MEIPQYSTPKSESHEPKPPGLTPLVGVALLGQSKPKAAKKTSWSRLPSDNECIHRLITQRRVQPNVRKSARLNQIRLHSLLHQKPIQSGIFCEIIAACNLVEVRNNLFRSLCGKQHRTHAAARSRRERV